MTSPHWFYKENPLTDQLNSYDSIEALAEKLAYDPLDGIDIATLPLWRRNELLVCEKQPLAPTSLSLRVAMTIHGMVFSSLRARNPLLPKALWQVDSVIEDALAGVDFSTLPPVPGACMYIVKGMTGLSKTVTLKRSLALLGKQFIIHPANPAANWRGATQLVYLYVGMSHDGSRGGLLAAILAEIDKVLGTDHSVTLPRQNRTVEKLAQATIGLLHKLYLGILVIDEMQWLNLTASDQSSLMHTFILSLVNSGIPTVLSGNPAGFIGLAAHTQLTSRAIERKEAFFHPCGAIPEDDEWERVAIGVTGYYVLTEPATEMDKCRLLLKTLGGGIARCALALWCIAQQEALFNGLNSIGPADIEAAYNDPSFDEMRPVCDGFSRKNPTYLWTWKRSEIPVELYARHWRKLEPAGNGESEDNSSQHGAPSKTNAPAQAARAPNSPAPSTGAAAQDGYDPEKAARMERAKLKRQVTRQRKREAAKLALAAQLEPGDMRGEGIKQHALTGLDALMGTPPSVEIPAEIPY